MKLSLLSAAAERVQTHNSAQCKQPFWLLIRVFFLYCHIKNMSRKTSVVEVDNMPLLLVECGCTPLRLL